MFLQVTQTAGPAKGFALILNMVLNWLYLIAHQIGLGLVKALTKVFPNAKFPADIVDPIGFVIILALFFLLVKFFEKIALWVLIIAGGLILLRIFLIILKAA